MRFAAPCHPDPGPRGLARKLSVDVASFFFFWSFFKSVHTSRGRGAEGEREF